jgi:glycosyltransferase involved in cell wall biosynthesis
VSSRRRRIRATRPSPQPPPDAVRVAVTCDWFLKYAVSQSVALAGEGAQVMLLCRTHANEFGGDERERAAALDRAGRAGVEVVEIPGRYSDPSALAALPGLRRRVTAFAPDIVHAHDGADPRALALTARLPAVLTVHDPAPHPGQPVPPLHKRWFLRSGRDLWRARARVLVLHSERLRAGMPLRSGQRAVVVAHGIDVVDRPLAPPSEAAVVFFGRLTPYKGLEVLAAAMPLVWAARPSVRLIVAGTGPERFALSDPRVDLRDSYLPESAVPALFGESSLAVLPYTEASQTGAGSLAVSFGVPVVVSAVGGLPDLALDASYVVAPGSAQELAAAILRHVDDGADVRARVLAEVAAPRSWAAGARASLAVYESLVGAAGPGR